MLVALKVTWSVYQNIIDAYPDRITPYWRGLGFSDRLF